MLPTDVTVTIDVTRTDSGLRVEPRVGDESRVLPLETSMLIGRPAHGIAWWEEAPRSNGNAQALGLAPLARPVDDNLRTFLRMATIDVPHHDEKRFMRAFVPKLSQKVELASSDGSVDLPDVRPTLVLAIQAGAGHRIVLTWTRGPQGVEGQESLWGAPRRIHQRAGEDAIIERVTAVARPVPELFERTPYGMRLAPETQLAGMAAVRFVTELLPLLEAIEGVKTERIGLVPEYREAAVAPVVNLGGSESADNDWFDLTIDVTVGGEEVPFADLFVALAAGQSHLILPSGTYFSLDREELRELSRLIAEARTLHDAPGDGIRLNRFQASLWEDLQRLGVVTAQASRWEASVRALAGATDRADHRAPDTLPRHSPAVSAHRLQLVGLPLRAPPGWRSADDMGLGKTLQALALMCHTKEQGLTFHPFLVMAPTSVVGNWAAECRRFAPDLDVVTVTETERRRGMSLAEVIAGADVVVTSYSLFRMEYEAYAGIEWAGLFLDEAQFAKNRFSRPTSGPRCFPFRSKWR